MKYSLYLSYRSEASNRWLKYHFAGMYDSYRDAEYYGDMIIQNHLPNTVRFKIV